MHHLPNNPKKINLQSSPLSVCCFDSPLRCPSSLDTDQDQAQAQDQAIDENSYYTVFAAIHQVVHHIREAQLGRHSDTHTSTH